MSDIFISYSRHDQRKVNLLAQHFINRGWSVWWDTRILVGKKFDEIISTELKTARCVVVVWSGQSVTSDWVRDEASEGSKRGILLPVMIEDVEIPLGFRRFQTADLTKWEGEVEDPGFQLLIESVQSTLSQHIFEPTEITRGDELSASLFNMNLPKEVPNRERLESPSGVVKVAVSPESDYEDIRRERFNELVRKFQPRLRAKRVLRRYVIGPNGDVTISESYESVQATDYPVGELKLFEHSESAFFTTPSLECLTPWQEIGFQWKFSSTSQNRKEGFIKFTPPIDKDMLSFSFRRTVFNAIAFNKQDKLEVDQDRHADESVNFKITQVCGLLIGSISFPGSHFPNNFRLHALDEKGNADFYEETHFVYRLSSLIDVSTITFTLDRPLPGYTYQVCWDLPDADERDLTLSVVDSAYRQEIVSRLLQLRSSDSTYRSRVEHALTQLKNDIQGSSLFSEGQSGDNQIELVLHSYSDDDRGLVCVAGIGDADISPSVWSQVIKPGMTSVGLAYRRREVISWIAKPNQENAGTELLDYEQGHTALLSIPLFFPVTSAARIAILTLASKSPTSNLISLSSNTAAVNALIEFIVLMFTKQLITSLDME